MGCSKRPVCLPPHQQAFLFGPNHLGPAQPCAFIMHQHLDSSYLWSMLNTDYYRVCITFDGNNQVALEILNLHSISGPFASEFFLHTVIEKNKKLLRAFISADISVPIERRSFFWEDLHEIPLPWQSTLDNPLDDIGPYRGDYNWEGSGHCRPGSVLVEPGRYPS